jgi:hypothetical protein
MEEQRTTPEDAKLVIDILKKALDYRPAIKEGVVGQDFLALSKEARVAESMRPTVAISYADEEKNIPVLFFRFVGAESPLIEAVFYPFEAILSFLSEARNYAKWISPGDSDPGHLEKIALDRSIRMTLILLDNFYRRAELMMESVTWEVILQWRFQNGQNAIHYHAERGESLPRQKHPLGLAIKDYTKKVVELWKYQGQSIDNWRKLRLAEEYEKILRHWKLLSREDNWREYAKAGKFQDTPDDLLRNLGDIDRRDNRTTEFRISELALEHAARRVGLIKHSVNESIMNRRKKGLKVTGYSSGQLFEFLKQGRALLAQRQASHESLTKEEGEATSTEQETEPAQAEKVKSLEQKLDFIKTKASESVEQNGNSAQQSES